MYCNCDFDTVISVHFSLEVWLSKEMKMCLGRLFYILKSALRFIKNTLSTRKSVFHRIKPLELLASNLSLISRES